MPERMNTRTFLDTNILVYAVDNDHPAKRAVALDRIRQLALSGTGVISTQVLQEFYSACTRKLGMDPLNAKQHVRDFRMFDVVSVSPDLVEAGIDCSILERISFWDGLILAAAHAAGCGCLLTEDLSHGQVIRGVSIENPFR
jgi:predicted nucleic acid-binding protein